MGRAIGIDLGTTNSCAAVIHGGRPSVITYRDGSKTIPSVFAIDKHGNRLVGQAARDQAKDNPLATVAASKRLIGRSFDSKAVDQFQQVFTYELVEGERNDVLVKVSDQVFTLEQISAAILRRIKESAEEALGEEVDQAVITVPAYFNDRQRQAVRAAGKIAGLKVLRVLNEPTAAALAFGLGRTLNQRVAIYDLGGGTFDISIIDIRNKIFEVVATGGDTFLGGVDFDDRLMQHILGRVADETGVDLSYDRRAVTMIRDEAEAAKIRLSSAGTTRVTVPAIGKDDDGNSIDLDMEIPRSVLEELTVDLIDRSIATCERILNEAGSTREQIDEILLVGGQSRMPLVRQKVQAFANKAPSERVHPDEAVAIGAAIMAHSLGAKTSTQQEVTLFDVLPSAIGITKPDGTMHVLFSKNQALPDNKTRTLTTSKDDQRSIMLKVYQGESKLVQDNELLGTYVFSGLRSGPKASVKVEVSFVIDSEGILNLTGRDRDTGEQVDVHLKLAGDEESGPRRTASARLGGIKRPATSPDAPQPAPAPAPAPAPEPVAATAPAAPEPASAPAPAPAAPAPAPGPTTAPAGHAEPLVDRGTPRSLTPPRHGDARPGPGLIARPPPKPPAPTSVWGRFVAWIKGLFGRK